jgi:hypothetical protein
MSFSLDTENIARAAVDEELHALLRGLNAARTPNLVGSPFGIAE